MKADKQLHQRDAKKLALTNNARLKRMARRKLETQHGDKGPVTEEMVSSALNQRKINQVDELSRRTNYQYQQNQRQFAPKKFDALSMAQLPAKPLKKNVVWLTLPQQEANANVSLTTELENFATYVQLDAKEEEARISMLLDIQDAVRSKFPQASISQFGSHPVGLSIFLSDVDISVDNTTSDPPAPLPALTSGTPSTTPTITPKRLSNTAHVASIVRRDSFGSNMSDGTIKRASSLVDNPISKRIKFNEDNPAPRATTSNSEEVEGDIEVTWSIDNSAGETSTTAAASSSPSTTATVTATDAAESKPAKFSFLPKPSSSAAPTPSMSIAAVGTRMSTRDTPKKKLTEDCFDSSSSSGSDSDYSAGGMSEPEDEDDENASNVPDDHSENDYFEELLNELEEDRSEDENSLEDGEEEDENEEFVGYTEPLKITRTPSANSLRFDEDGQVATTSAEKKVKLPLDIDVPFWDGANSVNAAESSFDGVLDETLNENLYLMSGSALKAVQMSEEESRKEKLEVLAKLFKTIKSMGWVQRIENRKHARVPILNLTHKNGVECDVSLDMSQQATSLVVRTLMQRSGPALATLSAFLKIYLSQLGLDAPFTGGLGSYKLYVLLAKHIERESKDPRGNTEPGPLLLSFLKYYGQRKNFNEKTVIDVPGAEPVAMDRTQKVGQIRLAFEKAYLILTKAHIERPVDQLNTHSYLANQVSSSQLGALINTDHLARTRVSCRNKCHQYPHRSEAERDAVARKLLLELHGRVADSAPVAIGSATLEEVKATNPALAARLRSFPSAKSAMIHLDSTENTQVGTKRGRDMQEIQDMMMGVETDRSAPSASVAQVPVTPSKVTRTCLVSLPAGSPLQGLEQNIPILTIQDNKPSKENRIFDPATHHKIITGEEDLPPGMRVPDHVLHRLPDHLRRALGPFRMLCIADTYLHKSHDELFAQAECQAAAVRKVQELYAAGHFDSFKCHLSDKTLLRKMAVANLLDESATKSLGLTKAEIKLQDESRQAQTQVRLLIDSRMPLPAKVKSETPAKSTTVSTNSAGQSSTEVIDLTDDAPAARVPAPAPSGIHVSSPLFAIQNDFLLFKVKDLGVKGFLDMVYDTYKSYDELSPVLHKQTLAATKVKNLFSDKYFDKCTQAEKKFLRRAVLTHLVGEKKDMNITLSKEDRQFIADCGDVHLDVQEYLKFLNKAKQGTAPALNPRQEREAQLRLPFDPSSRLGALIRQGRIELPETMIVKPEYRRVLPRVAQDKLELFQSIAEANSVKTLSYKELAQLQKDLIKRKKVYQKHFDDNNWDFFGPDDAARYPVLDDLIALNFIAEPEEWTFTKPMRKRLSQIVAKEKEFAALVEKRRAEEKNGVSASASSNSSVPPATQAGPVASTDDVVTEMRDSSADEAEEENSDDEGPASLYNSSASACSTVVEKLKMDIPLLVVLNPPRAKACRLLSPGAVANIIARDGLEGHPNMIVKQKHRHLLTPQVAETLGPFSMLCVAKYCLGRSFDDLAAVQNAQYWAVQRVKELFDEGHFENCSAGDTEFFRNVLLTGLLHIAHAPGTYAVGEKLRREACVTACKEIVQYMSSLSELQKYPSYGAKYPVLITRAPGSARQSSSVLSSALAPTVNAPPARHTEAHTSDYDAVDEENDADHDEDDHSEVDEPMSTYQGDSALIRELAPQIPLLAVLNFPKKKVARYFPVMKDEIEKVGIEAHPNMIVEEKYASQLPQRDQIVLGPFRMFCVADYCLGKSYDELLKQGEAEYQAVLKLKQLHEAGYFEDCPGEDLIFLRRVCATGLLQFESGMPDHRGFARQVAECERASKQIAKYAKRRNKQSQYPAHNSRYPVVIAGSMPQAPAPAPLASASAVVEQPTKDKDEKGPTHIKFLNFNPHSPLGKAIMYKKAVLPENMNVEPNHRALLPKEIVARLGPCKSLAERAQYDQMTYDQLQVVVAARDEKKATNQANFDAENWSFFGPKPQTINVVIDRLIATGMLDLPPGRSLTAHQHQLRAATLQVQEEFAQYVEGRRTGVTQPTKPSEVPVVAAASYAAPTPLASAAKTPAKPTVEAKQSSVSHLATLLNKRKQDEDLRRQEDQSRAVVQKLASAPRSNAAPIVITGLARPATAAAVANPAPAVPVAKAAVPIAKPVYALNTASATTTSAAKPNAASSAVPAVSAAPTTPAAAMSAVMALIVKREAEEKARALWHKRALEEAPAFVTSPAKKAKVDSPVQTPVAKSPAPIAESATAVSVAVGAPLTASVAAPGPAPIAVVLPTATNTTTSVEMLEEFEEEDHSEFPSLSKPVVLSGRRGSGRLSDPAPGAVASGHTPVPAVGAVVQQSQSIVQEIDELKQRLDENKRRFSLE